MFGSQDRKNSFGLLIMRLGLSAVLLVHSAPKLIGGINAWQSLGTMTSFVDLGVPAMVSGVIILLVETLGAVSLLFGYFFRIACTVLFLLFGLYFFNYLNLTLKALKALDTENSEVHEVHKIFFILFFSQCTLRFLSDLCVQKILFQNA